MVNILTFNMTTGLLGFAFWSTFVISGALALAHVCNLAQSIESKFPYFSKMVRKKRQIYHLENVKKLFGLCFQELGYVVIWSLVYSVACVLSVFGFGLSTARGFDLFFLFPF